MSDSIGSVTIVDRTSGWGHVAGGASYKNDTNSASLATVVEAAQDDDEVREVIATRVARTLHVRKSFNEDANVDIKDRTKGFGGAFVPDGGADEYLSSMTDESPVLLGDAEDVDNGIFYDESGVAETGVGSNTASTDSDTDAKAIGRTADSRDSVLLNDDDTTSRAEAVKASIIDRGFVDGVLTDDSSIFTGWGHSSGTLVWRSQAQD